MSLARLNWHPISLPFENNAPRGNGSQFCSILLIKIISHSARVSLLLARWMISASAQLQQRWSSHRELAKKLAKKLDEMTDSLGGLLRP